MHRIFLPVAALALIALATTSLHANDEALNSQANPAGDGSGNWLALGDTLARDADVAQVRADAPPPAATQPTSQPGLRTNDEGRTYVYWKERHGPAYPGDFWTSFGRWGKEMPETLLDDTGAVFTNWVSLAGIGAAGVVGITVAGTGVDNTVADHFTSHGHQLNSFWDSVGDAGGNPGTHLAVAGTLYITSLARMDSENYEKASALMNALIINDLATLGLQQTVRTHSPNGDPTGWPSGHTSSSFTFATVVMEEYGPLAGVPAFGFAAFVGYERIDARNHDFSDVLSGALLGMAIGHAIAQNHMPRINGFQILPYVDPGTGAVGVAATKSW